jgi:hypothetical protein
LHGFGSRLNDEDLAVFGPLHVHGAAVLVLDHTRLPRYCQNVLILSTKGARSDFDVGTLRLGRSASAAQMIFWAFSPSLFSMIGTSEGYGKSGFKT